METEYKIEYIKIYSYKKVKVQDHILKVLHVEDIAPAVLDDGIYEVLKGKFQGKYINPLSSVFFQYDFCCSLLTLDEKNLLTDCNPQNTDLLNIESYRKKCKIQYYIVLKMGNQILLKRTNEEKIIEEFNRGVNPSVADEFFSTLKQSKDGSVMLSKDMVSKMLGDSNNLPTENPNKQKNKKSIQEYAISEKYKQLKKKIIGLDEEIKALLANITKNISLSYAPLPNSKVKELKTGILIIGPRGSGKTFTIESIADLFGVPSTIEDATRFTPPAYQGADIEDILMNLYAKSEEKKEIFEHGIVFLDEIDKICKRTDPKDYALKESIQNGLLTILRGTTIHKKVQKGFTEETIPLDTSRLTFVLSGAFEELLDKEEITKEDLIKYGMIPQLADRIHLIIRTKNPTKEDLKRALTEGEYSYLKLLEEYLKLYEIPLQIEDDFIDYIVEVAFNLGTGYRALSTALTEYLSPILYDLYDGKLETVKLSKKVKEYINE